MLFSKQFVYLAGLLLVVFLISTWASQVHYDNTLMPISERNYQPVSTEDKPTQAIETDDNTITTLPEQLNKYNTVPENTQPRDERPPSEMQGRETPLPDDMFPDRFNERKTPESIAFGTP